MVKKKLSFELMRILAFLMVVFNHVFHYLFYGLEISYEWNVTALLIVVVKPAVPIFMMMSGALLLRKEYSSKELMNKIISVFGVLLLFSLFYYYFDPELQKTEKTFIFLFLSGQISNALWYMYVYLAFLIVLPFIKKMVDTFNEQDYRKFFLILLFFSMLFPYLLRVLGADTSQNDFVKFILSPYLLYFVFGNYYINVKKGKLELLNNRSYLVPLIYLVTLIFSTGIIILSRSNLQDFSLWNNKADSFQYGVLSIALFLMLNKITITSKIMERGIIFLGSKTYFAYLISDFVIHSIYIDLLQRLDFFDNVLIKFTIISICIAIICILFSLILNLLLASSKKLVISIKK
ncbi:acyltransferase [Candidatus Enterococcus mansonii]|uniref:Acyltransferase 3 domain-containing protein n=1 Tax=Candidatus Enterococcus mansonii TaxID=1834181 RepID=A0ABU8ICG2_9ENTE